MRGRALSACSFLLLGLASCGGRRRELGAPGSRSTRRVDALGAYGCKPSVTPNLDALAADGVVFEQAYTVAPAHPARPRVGAHRARAAARGVRDNGIAPLPQAAETLAERAQGAGFRPRPSLGSAVLDAGFGLRAGLRSATRRQRAVSTAKAGRPSGTPSAPPTRSRRSSRTGCTRDPEQPFLCWRTCGMRTRPTRRRRSWKQKARGNDYPGEVMADDPRRRAHGGRAEGREAVRYDDDPRGRGPRQAFAERSELSHGPFVWNTTVRVPLILHLPGGRRGGKRVASIASVVGVNHDRPWKR